MSHRVFAQIMFYQPLNIDKSLSEQQWSDDIHHLNQVGFHGGVIQWTQYGNERFGGTTGWLANRLNIWVRHTPIWLGLYSDPRYFSRIDANDEIQNNYLTWLMTANKQTLAEWSTWIQTQGGNIIGYYLPFELSDYYFRTKASRQILDTKLRAFVASVDKPVAISVFMSGILPPKAMNQWLISLHNIGLQVWLQDGQGTDALSSKLRDQHLAKLSCEIGVIQEVFLQTSASPFKAQPMTKLERNKGAKMIPKCHQRLVFSLRYWQPLPHPLSIPNNEN